MNRRRQTDRNGEPVYVYYQGDTTLYSTPMVYHYVDDTTTGPILDARTDRVIGQMDGTLGPILRALESDAQ